MLKLVVEPVPYATMAKVLHSPNAELGPRECGTVDLIVQRPDVNQRRIVQSATLTREYGLQGSGWTLNPERGRTDQLCVMSTAAIRVVAGDDKHKWQDAGDQLFIDFDLSQDILAVGDTVKIGTAICSVTAKPHNGCAKFAKRYGIDALKFVNNPKSKQRRIRGIYFEVIRDGVVNTGDQVVVIRENPDE